MKTYLHGLTDVAETLKLRFRVGDLDLPGRRKRNASSQEKEGVDAQMCMCGKAIKSRTHIAGNYGMHNEERGVVEEETREIDQYGMGEFGTLDSSEKAIAILGRI